MQDNDVNWLETSLLKYGIDLGLMVAGFFGALILSLRTRSQSIGKAIISILAGTISANYMTPIALNFTPEYIQNNGKYATAFIMGFIGLKSLELIYDYVTYRVSGKKRNIKLDINI